MYVGRTVTGLPINSQDFSLVGPVFNNHEACDHLIREFLPNCPDRLLGVAGMALASVIYHQDFLLETLGQSHPVRSNPLFLNLTRLRELKGHVVCGMPAQIGRRATGVPPHIDVLVAMAEMKQTIQGVLPGLQTTRQDIVRGVIDALNERDISTNQVCSVIELGY